MRLIVFYSFKIVTNRLQRVLRKVCKYPKKKKKIRKARSTSFLTLTRFRCSTPYFWIQALAPYFELQSRSPIVYIRDHWTRLVMKLVTGYKKKKPQISITEKMSPRKYCKINQLIFNQLRILLIWLLVFLICF